MFLVCAMECCRQAVHGSVFISEVFRSTNNYICSLCVCSTSESSEEEVQEKGGQSAWQTVSRRKPPKPEVRESHSKEQMSAVSASQSPVNVPVHMPIPRKHKKKSKGKGKGKKPPPEANSAVDVNPYHSGENAEIVATQSPTSKSKKHRRKHTDSLSSDEASSGSIVPSNALKDNKVSPSKEKKRKQKPRGIEIDLHLTENVKVSPSSPKADVQPKLSRLPRFTPTEIGPDEDPVFYHHSALSEAQKEDRIKDYLFRQIEGRKPLGSSPSAPTLFHMEESFGTLVPALSPSLPTPTATLVVQLTPGGLVQLPVPTSVEINEMLHSALLVWLASRATEDPPSAHMQPVVSCNRKENDQHRLFSEIDVESMIIGDVGIPSVSQVGFRVNGMLQTIQHGRPVILCGVVTEEGNYNISSQLGEMTFKVLFQTLGLSKELEQVSQCLDSGEILSQPFSTFLMLSDDVESFNRHVAFHCFTPCDSLGSYPCLDSKGPLEFTVISLPSSSLKRHNFLCALFLRISQESYGVAGLRLLYSEEGDGMLALALCRKNAVLKWMDVAGPDDPALAAVTDPLSISATFGQHGQELFAYARTPDRAVALLAKWFGGRCNLKERTIAGITDPETRSAKRKLQKVRFSFSDECGEENISSSEASTPLPSPIHCLALFPTEKVIIAISPIVPASSYGGIFKEVLKIGYQMFGIRFIRLNQKRALALGIPQDEIQQFTPRSSQMSGTELAVSPTSPNSPLVAGIVPPRPSVLLILGKEWGIRHSPALVAAIRGSLDGRVVTGCSSAAIHCAPYPESFEALFGLAPLSPTKPLFDLPLLAGSESHDSSRHDPELMFIGVTGEGVLDCLPHLLDSMLDSATPQELPPFELLGMKCVPRVSRYQAKLLLQHCHSKGILTVDTLTDVSAFVIALRAVQGHLILNTRIKDLLEKSGFAAELKKTAILYSRKPLAAFSVLCLFFSDRELFSDPLVYPLTPFLPPATMLAPPGVLEGFTHIIPSLVSLFAVEAKQHNLFLKILQKVANSNFTIVGLKISSLKSDDTSNSKVSRDPEFGTLLQPYLTDS